MTFKCTGCGAEVTVNTESTMTARCHWCRHVFGEGRRRREHPQVRRQAPDVRAEGVQAGVHPGKRGGRVPALHDRRRQRQRGRGRQGRDPDPPVHGGQREDQEHPL
ncbi:hypothetical protein G6F35_017705 [Rhizopus arrhizus]|nr:hypothetical protein G6F35_017705 [Rhizopus arrhizus]